MKTPPHIPPYLLHPQGPLRYTLELLRDRIPAAEFQQLLAATGLDGDNLRHPGSQALLRRLQELANNADILREAGRRAAAPGSLGSWRESLATLLRPATGLRYLVRCLNRMPGLSCRLERRAVREIDLCFETDADFDCSFPLGLIEGFVQRFLPYRPAVSHPNCGKQGDSGCRFRVSWERPAAVTWLRLRNLLLVGSGLALLGFPLYPLVAVPLLAISSLGALLMAGLGQTRLYRDLALELAELHQANEELVDQANFDICNTLLSEEVSQQLADCSDTGAIVRKITRLLEKRLEFTQGLVMLWGREKSDQSYVASFGIPHEVLQKLAELSGLIGRHNEPETWGQLFRAKEPLVLSDLTSSGGHLSETVRQQLLEAGLRNLICAPVVCDRRTIGILLLANLYGGRPPLENDLYQARSIASGLGLALHNIWLLNARSEQFKATLQILASSIDARDFLTAGHSAMVTEYAVGICNELGLSNDYSEMIRVAAMLHDYGKIGIPDFILKKNGPLTGEERAIIHTHPEKAREILQQIPFSGIYKQIPGIVSAHHEKLDGSGYPRSLKGDQISLGARIISVADFFDAVTARRHYREPMPLDDALNLVRAEAGCHFDEKIVSAFLRYANRHRQRLETRTQEPKGTGDRQRLRVPFRTQVSCQMNSRIIAGTSANLSAGGLFVVTENQIEPGAEVDIIFHLPENENPLIRARGRVAWLNNTQADGSMPSGFGLQFTDLSSEANLALDNFIAEHLTQSYKVRQEPVSGVH